MNAGKLRHQITIQQNTASADALGNLLPASWSTLSGASGLWASIENAGAREFVIGDQVDATITHKIRLRYFAGITPRMSVLFGSRRFLIQQVQDVDARGIELELLAVEQI